MQANTKVTLWNEKGEKSEFLFSLKNLENKGILQYFEKKYEGQYTLLEVHILNWIWTLREEFAFQRAYSFSNKNWKIKEVYLVKEAKNAYFLVDKNNQSKELDPFNTFLNVSKYIPFNSFKEFKENFFKKEKGEIYKNKITEIEAFVKALIYENLALKQKLYTKQIFEEQEEVKIKAEQLFNSLLKA